MALSRDGSHTTSIAEVDGVMIPADLFFRYAAACAETYLYGAVKSIGSGSDAFHTTQQVLPFQTPPECTA